MAVVVAGGLVRAGDAIEVDPARRTARGAAAGLRRLRAPRQVPRRGGRGGQVASASVCADARSFPRSGRSAGPAGPTAAPAPTRAPRRRRSCSVAMLSRSSRSPPPALAERIPTPGPEITGKVFENGATSRRSPTRPSALDRRHPSAAAGSTGDLVVRIDRAPALVARCGGDDGATAERLARPHELHQRVEIAGYPDRARGRRDVAQVHAAATRSATRPRRSTERHRDHVRPVLHRPLDGPEDHVGPPPSAPSTLPISAFEHPVPRRCAAHRQAARSAKYVPWPFPSPSPSTEKSCCTSSTPANAGWSHRCPCRARRRPRPSQRRIPPTAAMPRGGSSRRRLRRRLGDRLDATPRRRSARPCPRRSSSATPRLSRPTGRPQFATLAAARAAASRQTCWRRRGQVVGRSARKCACSRCARAPAPRRGAARRRPAPARRRGSPGGRRTVRRWRLRRTAPASRTSANRSTTCRTSASTEALSPETYTVGWPWACSTNPATGPLSGSHPAAVRAGRGRR